MREFVKLKDRNILEGRVETNLILTNYWGICVNSNLMKVFCCILYARLQAFLTEHNILSKSQIGFLPNHCTTDHIYTLHTIILFACFICLKKVFDSIWHEGLYFIIKVQNKNWQQKKWILPSRTRDEPGLQFESNFVQYLYKWITGAICNTWAHHL